MNYIKRHLNLILWINILPAINIAYVESSDLIDEILMEAIDSEKLKRMVTNFGVKASQFGSKLVQKLKEFIPKVIKFFKTYANKLFKKQHKFDVNKFRNIVKSSPKDLAI